MAKTSKKELTLSLILGVSFCIVLLLMFQPYFEGGKNFLAYSDEVFNQLTKGSSYFIPKLSKDVEKYQGKTLEGVVTLKKSSDKAEDSVEEKVRVASKLFEQAGATIKIKDSALEISGDMRLILKAALEDADAMYWNNDQVLKEKYQYNDAKKILRIWHETLSQINKQLVREKKTEEAKMINTVLTKAVEPAYNFFGINPRNIKEQALILTALLLFYLFYTIWWGYTMVYLTEGLGLSTKKAKRKKEV